MSARRILVVARLHGLDIIRRRLVLVLLVALPLAIYFAMGDDEYAVVVGGTLMTFSVAGPAIFVSLAGRGIDQRLTLAGFRPLDLVIGRLVLLSGLGITIAMLFGALVIVRSDPPRPSYTIFGVVAMALLAVPFGMALGAVLPGDLESMLAMGTVVGVQLVGSPDAVTSKVLPYHGAKQLLRISNDRDPSAGMAFLHAGVYFAVLVAICTIAVQRRSRVRSQESGPVRFGIRTEQ
jgi:hypothetical protein